MAEVSPRDILLRVGGRALQRFGVPAVAGAGRSLVELVETFARPDAATCATYLDRDGILRTAAAHVLRTDYEPYYRGGLVDADGEPVCGLRLEGSRTNVVLWNRDCTNAAWTKTNVTAIKDQTGIDGVVNSASRITATLANGTVLQAIVLASSARAQSAYVKRLIGAGGIDMTMDGGLTWTPIVVTPSWTRVTIPSQTLANPSVGFRIQTNGDAIAVDYVQNENGLVPSSPIATTAAAVTRAADDLTLPFAFGPIDCTILARVFRPAHADVVGALPAAPYICRLGTAVPHVALRFATAARLFEGMIDTAGVDATPSAALPAGSELDLVLQARALTTGGLARVDAGGGFGAEAGPATGFAAFGAQTLRVGGSGTAGEELDGVLIDLLVLRGLFSRPEAVLVP